MMLDLLSSLATFSPIAWTFPSVVLNFTSSFSARQSTSPKQIAPQTFDAPALGTSVGFDARDLAHDFLPLFGG